MLAGIGSLIAAAAIVKTYLKARNSIDEWKSKEQFREDRKLAIEALAAFEEGKQAIQSIRSPLSPAAECYVVESKLREAAKQQGVALEEDTRRNHEKRLTVMLRIDSHSETWARLLRIMPVAKAVFGAETRELLLEILRARQQVHWAADMFKQHLDLESTERYERIIWDLDDPEDDIARGLVNTEKRLFDLLEKFIRPESA